MVLGQSFVFIAVVWLLGAASPLLLAHIHTRRPLLLWLGCLSGAPFLLATLGAAVLFIWNRSKTALVDTRSARQNSGSFVQFGIR